MLLPAPSGESGTVRAPGVRRTTIRRGNGLDSFQVTSVVSLNRLLWGRQVVHKLTGYVPAARTDQVCPVNIAHRQVLQHGKRLLRAKLQLVDPRSTTFWRLARLPPTRDRRIGQFDESNSPTSSSRFVHNHTAEHPWLLQESG